MTLRERIEENEYDEKKNYCLGMLVTTEAIEKVMTTPELRESDSPGAEIVNVVFDEFLIDIDARNRDEVGELIDEAHEEGNELLKAKLSGMQHSMDSFQQGTEDPMIQMGLMMEPESVTSQFTEATKDFIREMLDVDKSLDEMDEDDFEEPEEPDTDFPGLDV